MRSVTYDMRMPKPIRNTNGVTSALPTFELPFLNILNYIANVYIQYSVTNINLILTDTMSCHK